MKDNNTIIAVLMACICITIMMWSVKHYHEENQRDEFRGLYWALQIGILMGIIHLWSYSQTHPDFTDFELQLCKNTGLIMAVFAGRQLFYKFVHFVFFSKEERQLWKKKYLHILSIESTVFLLMSFIIVFQPVTLQIATYSILIVLAIVKFFIFRADYKTIFQNIGAFLHFFVYFCTLEIAPIIFCWVFLGKIYD